MPDEGLVTMASAFSVRETIDRLVGFAQAHGLTVFARIDHAAGAAQAGLTLRPTELVIYGHAKGGTPLMVERQAAGIDLPLKALAYEDAAGKVWLTCNDAAWIARRHGLGAASAEAVKAMGAGIAGAMKAAAIDQGSALTNPVRDNPAMHRFELDTDGGMAVAYYQLADGVITFKHTEVPQALSGHGIGSTLVKGALEAARARNLKVVARCPFVSAYMGRHPEFNDLLQ